MSDVQKKLRALLPKDYAIGYRKYRPSSRENAKLCFSQIKHCTNDRVRKHRGTHIPGRSNSTKHAAASSQVVASTGPADSLSTCSIVPASIPGKYLFLEGLQHPTINDTLRSCLSTQDANSIQSAGSIGILDYTVALDTVSKAIASCQDSTQVNFDTVSVDWTISEIPRLHHGEYTTNVEYQSTSEQPVRGRPSLLADLNSQIIAGQSSTAQAITTSTAFYGEEVSSGTLSTRSLKAHLRDRHSGSSLEHIQSVLRYSSTNSWRSSLISTISSTKSRVSVASWTRHTPAVSENAEPDIPSSVPASFLRRTKTRLTEDEQKIWDDFVDEHSWSSPVKRKVLHP